DRQGICPEGWVIPSDYDLNQLEEEIATHPELYSSQTEPHEWQSRYEIIVNWRPGTGSPTADWWGRSMKSSTSVNSIDPQGLSYTDGTGFNALLVGFLGTGAASDYGTYSYCWSSSADSATAAWRRYLINNASGVNRSPISKYHSFPVRCKKI
ncbi:MAG: fibrobacter succinogenes major paralogous domain-containing protein, partial [Dysgonamonadaceae bacterium]|nr:fibrobacter succinogenes major paralogous domain-containing protein [Dysgonamonadaceae bacterium]